MVDALMQALLRQALLLSAGVTLLALLRPLLRRGGAGLSYAAWSLLPLLMLTPALPRPAREPMQLLLPGDGGWAPKADQVLPALAQPLLDGARAGLAVWLGVAALLLALQAGRQWRLARHGDRLPAGSSPALVGLWRPRVVLPTDFCSRFTPVERQLILAHEAVHRARADNLWNGLATLIACLHWWNPLAWWALSRLRADQELACDAAVLRERPDCRADYTRALLAAHGLKTPAAPLASRWGSVHPLVERIAMLNHPVAARRRHLLMLGLAMAGAAGTSYALQAAKAEPPVLEGFLQLRFDIRLSVDGKEISHPRLNSFPAAPSSIVFNEPDAPRLWKLALSSHFTDEQHLMVETELALSDDAPAILAWQRAKGRSAPPTLRQVAAPRLLVQDGGTGRIETTTPDGQHRLAMEIRVSSFRNASPDYSLPSSGKPQAGTQ